MPTKKENSTRQRRGARLPKTPDKKTREPQPDAFTLEEFRALLSEPITEYRDGQAYPELQEALERRREAIRNGDLLALSSALERCFQPCRQGFSFEDASLNPDLDPNFYVCEMPAWLLGEVSVLLYKGLSGDWPRGEGRHATAARRKLEAWRDIVRTWKVLRARERGTSLEDAFAEVAETLGGAGAAKTVEGVYWRVVHNLQRDPDYYRRIGPISPHLAEAAVGLPRLEK